MLTASAPVSSDDELADKYEFDVQDYSPSMASFMIRTRSRHKKRIAAYEADEQRRREKYLKRILKRIRSGNDVAFNQVQQEEEARLELEKQRALGRDNANERDSDIPLTEEIIEQRRSAVWSHIGLVLVPKIYKLRQSSNSSKFSNAKKLAQLCKRESKKFLAKTQRPARDVVTRARRASKEMLLFWRRNEKEEREKKKLAEKAEAERRRLEEEQREQRRQAKKLNFLISQTELYSHFFAKKLGASAPAVELAQPSSMPAIDVSKVDFADVEDSQLQELARQKAVSAVLSQQNRTREFDMAAKERREGKPAIDSIVADSTQLGEMDFVNPMAMPNAVETKQPKMLTCTLKPYQLKGLNWLANLYEQGISGILADDM